MIDNRKIGIIGIGPRGGFALERLIDELARKESLTKIDFVLFEATGKFGNGQVYDLDQVPSNWININERILELEKREAILTPSINISAFPSYHEWIDKDFEIVSEDFEDTYPPRAQVGKYLAQRFQSLIEPLVQAEMVTLYTEKVVEVTLPGENEIQIKTELKTYKGFDEALLTIGHQPTKMSKQISEWEKFASGQQYLSLFRHPYPVVNYLNDENLKFDSTIGVRGFGLAMIDVVRAITEKFGHFITLDEKNKRCKYQTDNVIKDLFVPFSLNGFPPVPKPLNARIDKRFKPSGAQIHSFEEVLGDLTKQQKAESPHFLIAAFAPIAANIYAALPNTFNPDNLSEKEIEKIIFQWLEKDSFEHPMVTSVNQPVGKIMQDFVAMATGKIASNLDYCIGQVWRHCQPSIYRKLSFNQCSDAVFAEIIALDESTKGYSYGPPVKSIQQLMALEEAGVLNLDFVNDPDFELTDKGWELRSSDKTIIANVMINSVLDAPQIKSVDSMIVKSMLSDNLIEAVHDDLGVTTDENAYLIPKNQDKKIPIALLGRLAKGTIMGVDAILECFGSRPQKWASQAAENHVKWLRDKK